MPPPDARPTPDETGGVADDGPGPTDPADAADPDDADRPDAERPNADLDDADRPDAERSNADLDDADRPEDADRPDADPEPDLHAFSALATAAYCPRKCYYARRTGDLASDPPGEVLAVRELAFRYPELADAEDAVLAAEPIAVSPLRYRRNLGCARASLDCFDALAAPGARDVLLTGKDCRGVAHKVVAPAGGPPAPSLLSAGAPPEEGVWEPQSVRAVAAAKALAWERERSVPRAFYEYPAHGVVREVELTARRTAAYRRTLAALRSIDGPPPRLDDDAKCDSCEYRERCGVQTRSLRSLLGL